MAARDAAVVSILGQEFHIACPASERPALEAAARLVDERMREVRGSGKAMGVDRCAVVAALNIANEYLDGGGDGGPVDFRQRIDQLTSKIDAVLELELKQTRG
ncbi:MAG: cell division protein ZapA [Acidiferrobacteraceae bacterium]